MKVKIAQSCPTLCDPINCSTPGLPVYHQLPEFTQTHVHRVGDAIQPSHPLSSPSPWTHQALLSVGFSRQEYWSGLPLPSPGDLPDPEDRTCVSCTDRQILYHQATWNYGSGINLLTGWVPPLSHTVVLNKPMVANGFPRSLVDKESPFYAGDPGSIPGSGRFPWRRKFNPL